MDFQKKYFLMALLIIATALISPSILAWGGGGSYGGGDSNSGWTHEICRVCHVGYAAEGVLPLPKLNPDNHHKLVKTKIQHETAPNWENEGVFGDKSKYNCLTCHIIIRNEQGAIDTAPPRDCLNCHDLSTVTGYRGNRHMDRSTIRCPVCHCRMPAPGPQFGSCSDGDGSSWGGR